MLADLFKKVTVYAGLSILSSVSLYAASVDLSITKSSLVSVVNQSTPLSYQLVITNNSGSTNAEDVVVTDTLAPGMAYLGYSYVKSDPSKGGDWSCTPAGIPVMVTCNTAEAYKGDYTTITLNVTAPDSNVLGTVTFDNSASVDTTITTDPSLTNNVSSTVTVTLNRPPVALNDSYSTASHTAVSGNVLSNDYDLDNNPSSNAGLTIVSPGIYTLNFGELVINSNGSFTYTPGYFTGETDTYTYTVQDTRGAVSTATLQISIGSSCTATGAVNGERSFCLRKQTVLFGDMLTIGNTLVVPPSPQPSSPSETTYCAGYTTGNFLSTTPGLDNQSLYLCSYKPDSYLNATSAELLTPTGSKVKWAGLYFQAVIRSTDVSTLSSMDVKIKKDSGSYLSAGAPVVVNYDSSYASNGGRNYGNYSAFIDVTSVFTSNNWENGNYTVANIPVTTDTLEGGSGVIGKYGGWSLVVIYEDITAPLKSVSIYDGWKKITGSWSSNSATITVDNFYTPTTGDINSTVSIFVAEGDAERNGAYFKTGSTSLGNAADAFESLILSTGTRTPSLTNNQGIDIQTYQLGTSGYDVLANSQSSISFTLSTGGEIDYYYPSMLSFSTEVYHPRMCYYENLYDSSDTLLSAGDLVAKGSTIHAKVLLVNDENEPAENVLLYRNFDSTFPYVFNSTGLKNTGNPNITTSTSAVTDILDTDLFQYATAIDQFALNVGTGATSTSGGDFNYNQTALFDYNATAKFDGNTSIVYQIAYTMPTIGFRYEGELAKCVDFNSSFGTSSSPGVGNADFNMINDLYDPYYNLPTQVTARADNFKVIALESGTNTRKDLNTSVAIELVDADSSADCESMTALGTKKVWIMFKNSDEASFRATDIINHVEWTNDGADYANYDKIFYQKAVRNAKFRISYSPSDTNGYINMVETSPGSGLYHLSNFTALAGDTCAVPFVGPTYHPVTGAFNGDYYYQLVPTACGNSGVSSASALTEKEVAICMRCIYGAPPTSCSQDSFAIRPEAFMIKLKDQNQSAPATQQVINDNVSGQAIPSGQILQLAAGYNYNLEVNATNYYSNTSSPGYSTNTNKAEYIWEPRSGAVPGCNDIADKTTNISFVGGSVDTNLSNSEVGEYRLTITDTTWTDVDSNLTSPSILSHSGPNFLTGADCTPNSTIVNAVSSATTKNGCNISSQHTSASASGLAYRDYNVTFHPYKFNMGIVPSHGLDNNITFTANTFIYMADMSQDQNMSFHLNGNIDAVGFNGVKTTNFVDNCYAEPITLSINKSAISGAVAHQYRFNNTDIAANVQNADINGTLGAINLNTNDFNKSQSGTVNTILNLNFNRGLVAVMNPEELTFSTYDANCTTLANCTMNADLIATKRTEGSLDLNQTAPNNNTRITLKHYYGRAHASRQRYEVLVGGAATGTANIYYEVYCFNTIGGNTCQKTRLQQGALSTRSDDSRWFINQSHTSNEGNGGTVVEKDSLVRVTALGATTGNHPDNSTLMTYNASQGYPYKTTMEHNASRWLIYNEDNPAATRNQFAVEFDIAGTGWSGAHETNTTTNDPGTATTNRRSMW